MRDSQFVVTLSADSCHLEALSLLAPATFVTVGEMGAHLSMTKGLAFGMLNKGDGLLETICDCMYIQYYRPQHFPHRIRLPACSTAT